MTKKKIIAIILFLFLSLFMFTFANPGDIKSELKEPEKTKEEKPEEPKNEEKKEAGEEKTYPVVNNNTNDNKENKKKLEAPVIEIENNKVVILLGEDYDVMEGVKVISEEKLTVTADITDTTKLGEGTHTITYTATDSEGNSATATRDIVVLDPNKDEDGDGFSNGEEIIDGTDPTDAESFATTVEVDPASVKIVKGTDYDVMTGVTVKGDKNNQNLGVIPSLTDTTTLEVGEHTVTYTADKDSYEKRATGERTLKVLDSDGDEDGDGFTNGEELEEGTDFDDKDSFPTTIEVDPASVKIVKGTNYDVMTGVTVKGDKNNQNLTATASLTDTTTLEVGQYTVIYSLTDNYGKGVTANRTVKVLDPEADEDGDGFTNGEELEEGTDFDDNESYPTTIEVDPASVKIVKGTDYDVMEGVTVKGDKNNQNLVVTPSLTDTTTLEVGEHTVTYTVDEDSYGKVVTGERLVKVLDPEADEDGDGFTNEEELEEGTDFDDNESYPTTIEVDPTSVKIVEGTDYNVMTGVTVKGDKNNQNLGVTPSLTDTTTLEVGEHTVTYTVDKDSYGKVVTGERALNVLSRTDDEDGDGYTNGDEVDNGFDPFDSESHPELPTLELLGKNPYPMLQNQEDDFVDPGYNFTVDPSSAESSVVVTGIDQINKTVVNTYNVTYSLTDKYGVNVTKTREVKVLDPNGDEDQDGITNGEEFEDETDPLDPESRKYRVTFYGYNNVVLKSERVNKGETANAPVISDEQLRINGFEFYGWNPNEFANIQSDLDVYAIYNDVEAPIISLSSTKTGDHSATINATVTDNDSVQIVKIASGDYSSVDSFPLDIATTLSGNGNVYSFDITENDDYTVYAVDPSGNASVRSIRIEDLSNPQDIPDDFEDDFINVKFSESYGTDWIIIYTKTARKLTITAKEGVTIKNVKVHVSDNGIPVIGGWGTDYVRKSYFDMGGGDVLPTNPVNYEIKGGNRARVALYVEVEYNGNTYTKVYRTMLSYIQNQ